MLAPSASWETESTVLRLACADRGRVACFFQGRRYFLGADKAGVFGPSAVLFQVDIGNVDARQVLQFKHHRIGILLRDHAWDGEMGGSHGLKMVKVVGKRTLASQAKPCLCWGVDPRGLETARRLYLTRSILGRQPGFD